MSPTVWGRYHQSLQKPNLPVLAQVCPGLHACNCLQIAYKVAPSPLIEKALLPIE
jgi:hypothetical protein